MICQPCADRDHHLCRGGTWCDCQHRTKDGYDCADLVTYAWRYVDNDKKANT